jgi:phage shock protein A
MFDEFNSTHSREKATYEEALDAYEQDLDNAEAKIEKLEDRIRVLERIVTDEHKTNSLADEIDNLRQKNG